MPVTDLLFPPWCCDCGAPTLARQPFRTHHNTGVAFILIPVCETCQQEFRKKYRPAFWRPLAIVLLVVAGAGFAVGTIPALTGRDPQSFPILPILSAAGLVVICSPVVWIVIRRRALRAVPPPVQLRRYIRNREVSFRFRRPDYTADFVSYVTRAARAVEQKSEPG